MKNCLLFLCLLLLSAAANLKAQNRPTRFEQTNGSETATYAETISYYQELDKSSGNIYMKIMGPTDAGYPLHLVLFSADGKFDPVLWHKQGKVVILVNNGIHPGEPDGIDASMMLLRDLASGKLPAPVNVVLAVIPVYNIGGCLNRGTSSRANQNGPLEYGFRGNSQNLDLNRDFTKNDSREAQSFTAIFHWLDADVLIDNHVSDGADFQHIMTMLTTQYNKLGSAQGEWLRNNFEPGLYRGMQSKNFDMCPYVDFGTEGPDKGMVQFYDPPRYSSGYAALWQCLGFVPETHMLKPYKDRVVATYAFMQTMLEEASKKAVALVAAKKIARAEVSRQSVFPLGWQVDSSRHRMITFKGYEQDFKKSDATGMNRMFYDHTNPYTKQVKFYDVFTGNKNIVAPSFYVIPQGWYAVVNLLKQNGVQMRQLTKDTNITVQVYHIEDYTSGTRPYEKHHKNSAVKTRVSSAGLPFLKGDWLIPTAQPAKRYLVEMLEPTGDDSFFAWNFFDAILQQKEGYSDYRWDDVAAQVLRQNPAMQTAFTDKKKSDTTFAGNAAAQLNWIYKQSPYYEPAHLRYPVYRIL